LVFLLFGDCFSIEPHELFVYLLHFLLVLLLLVLLHLLLGPWLFNVIQGLFEIYFDVGVHHANLVLRLRLYDVDCIVPSPVVNVNCIALVQGRVVGQFLL
jgi:hypothetical protein